MPLYKYVNPKRIDIITNLELRFTQPGALNDPFEFQPQFQSLISESQFQAKLAETPVDLASSLREAYNLLSPEQQAQISFERAAEAVETFLARPETKASVSTNATQLFREMMPELTRSFQEQLYSALNGNIGILSLSEVPNNELMWAHYADSHRGIVIGFNEAHTFFNRRRTENDEFYYLRQVVYRNLAPVQSPADLDADAVLVSKGANWAYEREWRMLAPLKDADRSIETPQGDLVYLYAFPAEALTHVILGARATSRLEDSIRSALNRPNLQHVHLSRARLDSENHRVVVD